MGSSFLLVWLILGVIGVAAAVWLSLRLWTRRRELPLRTMAVGMVLAASAVLGALGTVVGLVKALGAIGGESVDPSQTARILAEGISEAMNCTALGFVVGIPSAIALVMMMRSVRSGATRS